MFSTTTSFVLTQAGQDYIMLLGAVAFLYLIGYRLFVDYWAL